MRWFSIRAQICASRPSAVRKKSGARSARKRRWKSRARAAASNAGPRLAEVAGSAKRSERSCDVGRDGIGKKQTPRQPKLAQTIEMEGFSQIRPKQNPLQSAPTTELCFIHEFAENCYEFLSAPSRAAMTAPRLASSTTGAR